MDCFTIVKANDWYNDNTSDLHWGCLLLRLDYYTGCISLLFFDDLHDMELIPSDIHALDVMIVVVPLGYELQVVY